MKVFIVHHHLHEIPERVFSCLTRAKEYVSNGEYTIFELPVDVNPPLGDPFPIIYHWLDEGGEWKTNV